VLARVDIAVGATVGLMLLLVLWGPTAQTRRPLSVIVLAVIFVVSVLALRRITTREFPDAAPGDCVPGPSSRGVAFGAWRPAGVDQRSSNGSGSSESVASSPSRSSRPRSLGFCVPDVDGSGYLGWPISRDVTRRAREVGIPLTEPDVDIWCLIGVF
jgi:hypothetical protein